MQGMALNGTHGHVAVSAPNALPALVDKLSIAGCHHSKPPCKHTSNAALLIPHDTLLKTLHRRLPAQARRNVVRSVFTIVIVFLDYMLMLIVMTFNVGIIVSAVLGFGLGALLFGEPCGS